MNKEIKVFNETEINRLLDENLLGGSMMGNGYAKHTKLTVGNLH